MLYVEIRIKGFIDEHWAQRFDCLDLAHVDGESILRGEVIDQAALYGLLTRLRDLGLPLVSVHSSEEARPYEAGITVEGKLKE